MKKILLLFYFGILLSQSAAARTNALIEDIIKSSFKDVDVIEAEQLILTKSQYEKIKQLAKAAIPTKVYRYYTIRSTKMILGKAVLITRKVRTKKATVLYAFDHKGKLKFSEIMVFNEPPEYKPNKIWLSQLSDVPVSDPLTMGKDITTITGATLSARTVSDGARIARAIHQTVLK